MLLLDTDVVAQTSTGAVLVKESLNGANLNGVVVYDKYSDEDSLLGLETSDTDNEDYIIWRFTTQATKMGVLENVQVTVKAEDLESLEDSTLDGKFWCIDTPTNQYYVWYNTSGVPGQGDPSIPGRTGVEVAILAGDTAEAVATATATVLNGLVDMSATSSNSLVDIKIMGIGDVVDATDGTAGVTVNIISQGGENATAFAISNGNLYPKLRPPLPDYTQLQPLQFNVITEFEWSLVQSVFRQIDLVRNRYPNLGKRVLGMGFSGGFEKKFTIEEVLDYIYQTVVELNLHPPVTFFWFQFYAMRNSAAQYNPYNCPTGIPYQWSQALIQGAVIKALLARQVFEIDTNFNISDAGLTINYDRDSKLGGIINGLLSDFEGKKKKLKWQHVGHAQSGLGTYFSFGGHPIFQNIINSINLRGVVGIRSLSPFFSGGRPAP